MCLECESEEYAMIEFGDLSVSKHVDWDGDIAFNASGAGEVYLNKKEVRELIEHLKSITE